MDATPVPRPSLTGPPYGARGLAVRCFAQGRAAGAAGYSPRSLPYDSSRRFSQRAWLTGWVQGARAAGLPLPSDLDDLDDSDSCKVRPRMIVAASPDGSSRMPNVNR